MRKLSLGLGALVALLGLFTMMGATVSQPKAAVRAAPAAAPAAAPGGVSSIYMTVEGQIQGQIRSELTLKGKEGQIKLDGAEIEIVSPRDAASGLPTGKRQHKPLNVTMRTGKQSPMLFQALVNNENLKQVAIKFYRPSATGKGAAGAETHWYTVQLTNASIASYHSYTGDGLDQLEEVSFIYQKIVVTYVDGGVTAEDDWEAPVA